jgi:AcrR family transcriptional regulator
MARPQSPDFEHRRSAILAKCAELFALKGYRGTSMSDLAVACGSSKALVYHYFPSKEDLLFAIMDDHVKQLEQINQTLESQKDLLPDDRLRWLTRQFMAAYAGAAHSQKVLLNELHNLPDKYKHLIVERQRGLIHAVEQLVSELRPKLQAKPIFRTPTAMLYFGMINWTHTWFDPNGPLSVSAFADLATDIVLDGLRG